MGLKREFEEGDVSGSELVPHKEPKREQTSETCVVSESGSSNEKLRLQELMSLLLVHKEWACFQTTFWSDLASGRWKLRFMNNLPHTIFKGKKIEAEGNTRLQIAVVDGNSNEIVKNGPMSFMAIGIVLLPGEFGDDGQEDCSEKVFDASVVKEVDNRPFLVGNLTLKLRDGVGFLGDFTFSDYIAPAQCGKFRLGARVDQQPFVFGHIRGARSSAFIVKDQPGEAAYRKHEYPNLYDEVWRLSKIEKGGARHIRLANAGIHTVRDFLRKLTDEPLNLRKKLGGRRLADRTWETVVGHARKCIIDEDTVFRYSLFPQKIWLYLNCIFELKGAVFEDRQYVPWENFTISQMRRVEEAKKRASSTDIDAVRELPIAAQTIQI